MITSLQLLDAAECTQLEAKLNALREHWTPRGPEPASFFTLGAASYLDEGGEYYGLASRVNPILREELAWLYARLIDFLARRLRAPVSFAEPKALPGFHIWLTPAIFVKPMASVHFDLQYLRVWPEALTADTSRHLSFTLPIRLPRRGGGLNVWDVTYERYCQFCARVSAPLNPADVTLLLERMRHPYTIGAMAIHSGHLLHQIGEIDEVVDGDQRITLQGHALRQGGEWKVYW